MFTELKQYPAVGTCIYCGSENYNAERVKLGDEHIIPKGMGGDLLLKEASCAKCEKKINRAESFCQTDMLLAFRYKLGIKGRKRKKKKSETIEVSFIFEDKTKKRLVPFDIYPVRILVPLLPPPSLTQPKELARTNMLTYRIINFAKPGDDVRLLSRYKAEGARFESGVSNTILFARMLAKIAHSYTCAKLGLSKFHPLLIDFILGDQSFRPDIFIGGGSAWPTKYNLTNHHLELTQEIFNDQKYWVCHIQLFDAQKFPEYIVIVGLDKSEKSNNLVFSEDKENLFYQFKNYSTYLPATGTLFINPISEDPRPASVWHVGKQLKENT